VIGRGAVRNKTVLALFISFEAAGSEVKWVKWG
jgi:hypothetical protein